MVVFTCGSCGESIRKPTVFKHKYKCKIGVLTCMDCLKDFSYETYAEHTTCISEEQKYSGKNYVQKESSNAGRKKQVSWTNNIRCILQSSETNKVSPQVRPVLMKLLGYENVPRKKNKFENFVINSLGCTKTQAQEAWKIIEKSLEQLNKGVKEEMQTNSELKEEKIKHNDVPMSFQLMNAADSTHESNEISKCSSKNENRENNIPCNKENDDISTAKDTKILNKNVKRSGSPNNCNRESLLKKMKKECENMNAQIEHPTDTSETLLANIPTATPIINSADKFDWKMKILEITAKHPAGIEISKLKKKVLKAYKKHYNCIDISHKVEKTFLKKIKKCPSVSVESDILKLKH